MSLNLIISFINNKYDKALVLKDSCKAYNENMGIGDWGLGIGDWGLGIGPNPQSPIPNPQL